MKKINEKKNIAYKKGFWNDLKEDIKAKSISDFNRLRSYYLGYLHGLMVVGIITELEQSKRENRLITRIDCEITDNMRG